MNRAGHTEEVVSENRQSLYKPQVYVCGAIPGSIVGGGQPVNMVRSVLPDRSLLYIVSQS